MVKLPGDTDLAVGHRTIVVLPEKRWHVYTKIGNLLAGKFHQFSSWSLKINEVSPLVCSRSQSSVVLPATLMDVWEDGGVPQGGALSVIILLDFTGLTIIARTLAQRRSYVSEMTFDN